jgi:hypothetical protein
MKKPWDWAGEEVTDAADQGDFFFHCHLGDERLDALINLGLRGCGWRENNLSQADEGDGSHTM